MPFWGALLIPLISLHQVSSIPLLKQTRNWTLQETWLGQGTFRFQQPLGFLSYSTLQWQYNWLHSSLHTFPEDRILLHLFLCGPKNVEPETRQAWLVPSTYIFAEEINETVGNITESWCLVLCLLDLDGLFGLHIIPIREVLLLVSFFIGGKIEVYKCQSQDLIPRRLTLELVFFIIIEIIQYHTEESWDP